MGGGALIRGQRPTVRGDKDAEDPRPRRLHLSVFAVTHLHPIRTYGFCHICYIVSVPQTVTHLVTATKSIAHASWNLSVSIFHSVPGGPGIYKTFRNACRLKCIYAICRGRRAIP